VLQKATSEIFGINGVRSLKYFLVVHPFTRVTGGWSDFGELAQNLGLIVTIGEVKGAGVERGQSRLREDFEPDFAAAHGDRVHLARGLADGPDHAEVADRRAGGRRAPLKQGHTASAPHQYVGMSES
jgi:hypothetical protein